MVTSVTCLEYKAEDIRFGCSATHWHEAKRDTSRTGVVFGYTDSRTDTTKSKSVPGVQWSSYTIASRQVFEGMYAQLRVVDYAWYVIYAQ